MNRTLPTLLRTALTVIAIVVAVSAVLALAFFAVAHWLPGEISTGRLQWGDHSVALSSVFSGSLPEFFFAFGLMTLAILIGVVAIVFALAATVLALTATAGVLALTACIIGLPFLLMVGVVWWWAVRRKKSHGAIPSPGVQA